MKKTRMIVQGNERIASGFHGWKNSPHHTSILPATGQGTRHPPAATCMALPGGFDISPVCVINYAK
jgi:hypothetical protein